MADNGIPPLPPGFTIAQAQPNVDSGQNSEVPALPTGFQLQDEKYGTPGQQVVTGIEGLAKGIAGPIATGAEEALHQAGFPGLSPEDRRGRAESNPVTSGASEALGFGAGAFLGTSEAKLLGGIGEAASKGAGLGLEGASTISRIASQGIKTGAEMAALQTGDELSKMINQDPGQSLGSAAINVGLSGLIGGAGGAAIGTVSPLWKASMEKIGAPKLIDDAKAQYKFRQELPNGGDVPASITEELGNRLNEVNTMREQMGNLKGSSLARAMPEVTPENSAKIDSQIQEISDKMARSIEKASDNSYLKGAVPKLAQDYKEFLEVVTKPEATYAEKFSAMDDLKRAQQAKAKYNLTEEDTALGGFTKDIARDLRIALEDNKIWGDAGDIQRKTNAAIKASIDAEKDAASKFTVKSAVEGGRIVDPAKVNTLVSQSLKGKAGLREDFLKKYIEHTDNLADTLNKIHTDAGLEAPIRLTPTPALNHTLGRSSPGTTLGNWLFDKGLATAAGDAGGAAVGGGLGTLVGHPALGAVIGERVLSPTLTAIAKPLLENATRSEAAKGAIDYIGSVLKGEKILGNATKNFFMGTEVLPKHLVPNAESREKLQKSLDDMSNPENALKIGGTLSHYLPSHGSAAAATAATATNYFNALRPTQPRAHPLDKLAPINKMKEQQYNRALDIAQQPLMTLHYAKHGTLQAQDVHTLTTLYPQTHSKIVSKLSQEMIKATSEGRHIPYQQRQSLSLLLGTPLDSTLSQQSMMSIMSANAPKGGHQQPQGSQRVSKASASSMQKVNSLYATPSQARAASRTSSRD